MNKNHTPGTWKVEFCLDQSIFINAGEEETPIAMIQSEEDNGITPEMEANAKLIAAAPELLHALNMWVDYHDSDMSEAEAIILEKTKAAIKAATE